MVDKYIYPGTRVLINKLDIRDGKKILTEMNQSIAQEYPIFINHKDLSE